MLRSNQQHINRHVIVIIHDWSIIMVKQHVSLVFKIVVKMIMQMRRSVFHSERYVLINKTYK